MNGFTAWLQAHRVLRVVLIAAMFPVPITNLLSGGLVALVAQLSGGREAAVDSALALLILSALVALSGGLWWVAALGAGVLWGGAVVGGHLIGRQGSMNLAFQLLVALTLIAVVMAGALVADPSALWKPLLEQAFSRAGLTGFKDVPAGWLEQVLRLMHGLIGASALTSVLLSLLVGSWLASRAGGPGFRAMFLAISMGRVLAVVALAVAVVGLAGFPAVAGNLLLVLGTGFALQGLSIVHWLGIRRQWPAAWPLVLYVPLLLSPPLAGAELLLLATTGFLDNWYSLRRPLLDVV